MHTTRKRNSRANTTPPCEINHIEVLYGELVLEPFAMGPCNSGCPKPALLDWGFGACCGSELERREGVGIKGVTTFVKINFSNRFIVVLTEWVPVSHLGFAISLGLSLAACSLRSLQVGCDVWQVSATLVCNLDH